MIINILLIMRKNSSYDVTLRFWAGTYGTTGDEYLMPDANREDFTVKNLALKLINGNVYYPGVNSGPDDAATSAKTILAQIMKQFLYW